MASYPHIQTNQKYRKIVKIALESGAKSSRVRTGNCDSGITDEETYKLLVEDGKAICSVVQHSVINAERYCKN